MLRSLKKTGLLLLWMLLGLIIGVFLDTLCHGIYDLLYEYMPHLFPLYNPILNKAEYERFALAMAIISVSLTLMITVYICQRFNNDRFEFIITKTDGLYKIPGILKTYIDNFVTSDIISSVFTALVFTVPIHFIPRGFFTKSTFIVDLLLPLRTVVEGLGIAGAALYTAVAIVISHAITLPLVLKFYRAKWLTGFAEGTV